MELESKKQINRQPPLHKIKIVVLGERGSGKSTLINKLASLHSQSNKHQSYQTNPNIGCEFHRIATDKLNIHIWDTPGFHRFADSIRLHLHETNIILLMYSVVDFANYGELKFWARLVEGINAKVIVLANKIDDRYSFQKRDQEISAGRVLAEKKGYMFLEMSALTGENIERLLDIILKDLEEKQPHTDAVQKQNFTIGLLDRQQKTGMCRCSIM